MSLSLFASRPCCPMHLHVTRALSIAPCLLRMLSVPVLSLSRVIYHPLSLLRVLSHTLLLTQDSFHRARYKKRIHTRDTSRERNETLQKFPFVMYKFLSHANIATAFASRSEWCDRWCLSLWTRHRWWRIRWWGTVWRSARRPWLRPWTVTDRIRRTRLQKNTMPIVLTINYGSRNYSKLHTVWWYMVNVYKKTSCVC